MSATRLFVDDSTRKDPRALITTAKLAFITGITSPVPQYIVPTGDSRITVIAGCVMTVESGGFFVVENSVELSASNLDTGGAFVVGKDYYVYICDTGILTENGRFVISLNGTFPTGWTAKNSRKIGGFHYGKCRRSNAALQPINAANAARGEGWEANIYDGILPRSIWTTKHRPKCEPEGMVYLRGGTWVDVYLSSDDGKGGMTSLHGKTPLTGTEGLNWYGFIERHAVNGKRLLTYEEFCAAALGSPQGGDNLNAWTAGSARALTGHVARAVSSIGCVDCVGNVWEWLGDLITNASGRVLSGTTNPVSYTYTDRFEADGTTRPVITNGTAHGATTRADTGAPAVGAWAYDRVSPFPGYGNIYEYYDQSLIALIAGGDWNNGANAGARAVNLYFCPWYVSTYFGARGACDSL